MAAASRSADATEKPSLKARLEPYRALVEAEMRRHLTLVPKEAQVADRAAWLASETARREPNLAIHNAIGHVVEAGGKRIRPILTLLAAEAISGDRERALPTAAGLELLHTFTLVHDDVMDNDLTRRGQPTVHALWGGPIAITAGDGLYALAFMAIAANADRDDVDSAEVVRLMRDAAQVSFDICNGQAMDLLFEESEVDLAAYEEMIRLKTGVLIEFACVAGARIAGADAAHAELIQRYGHHLGQAFQVTDDLLDLLAHEQELGKPVGSDIRAGKKTFPVLHALGHAETADRARLHSILDAPEDETTATMVAEAIRILDHSGALAAAQAHARHHIEAAKSALGQLKEIRSPDAVATLADVADYILDRRN